MRTVFLTGASGYVGGQILKEIARSHPEFHVTALVRNDQVAKQISNLYPKIKTIIGSLDDADVVEQAAFKASIVLNAASNKDIDGAKAIYRGLSKRNSPAYWIQISGASALAVKDLSSPSYDVGLPSSAVFDDLDGIDEIRTLLRDHPTARAMDNYILDVSKTSPTIKTALILPPIIYGKGEGPVNQRSIQIPSLARVTLQRGHVVRAGAGANRWGSIHVGDIARVFTGLAEEAVRDRQDKLLWNENGIYLTSAGEMSFAEISEKVSRAGREKGLIQSSEVEQLSKTESDKVLPGGSVFFGSNARAKSRRASDMFGWRPTEESLEEEIPRAVDEEARRLA